VIFATFWLNHDLKWGGAHSVTVSKIKLQLDDSLTMSIRQWFRLRFENAGADSWVRRRAWVAKSMPLTTCTIRKTPEHELKPQSAHHDLGFHLVFDSDSFNTEPSKTQWEKMFL